MTVYVVVADISLSEDPEEHRLSVAFIDCQSDAEAEAKMRGALAEQLDDPHIIRHVEAIPVPAWVLAHEKGASHGRDLPPG